MTADANREGFRILRREPALFAMELLWRWSFGLGLLALLFFAYAHFREAVLLSDTDLAALSGQDPFAIAQTAGNVLAQSMPLLLRTLGQVFTLASVLWIAAASLGRGIITRILVRRCAADYGVTIAPDAPRWAAFATLMFARVVMLLILVIGYLGGGILASLIAGQNLLGSALIVFASLSVACFVWCYVNWVLSLAPIFVARDALSPMNAIIEAVAFLGRNRHRLTSVAMANASIRGLAATIISVAGVFTVAVRSAVSPLAVSILLVLETLAYLVVSDAFLLARHAAYISVACRERTLTQVLSPDHSGTIAR